MAMVKCPECNAEISSKAKTCPSCGAPNKPRRGLITYMAWGILGVMAIAVFRSGLPPETAEVPADLTAAPSNTAARDAVVKHFKSGAEPTAKDAIWTSETMFKVGVLDDGTSRDGYALYVCEVLNERGFHGVDVEVVDIVSVAAGKGFKELGSARCR